MKALRFLLIGFGVLLMASCSSDEPNENGSEGVRGDEAEKYELNTTLYDTAEECYKANPIPDGGAEPYYFAVEGRMGYGKLKYLTDRQYYEVPADGEFIAVNSLSILPVERFKYENAEMKLSDIDGCTAWTAIETEDDIQKLLYEAPKAELVWRTAWSDYVDLPEEYGDLSLSKANRIGIKVPVNTTGKTRVMAWNFGRDSYYMFDPEGFTYHSRHPLLIVQRAK